jgi:tetratricopeptide (TPR) repeat protein
MRNIIVSFCVLTCFVFGGSIPMFCQNGISFYNQGVKEAALKNLGHSIELYTKGIEINDISVYANYLGRAQAHFELNDYLSAKKDIESSLKGEKFNSDKINSSLYWLKGLLFDVEGNAKSALIEYKKAVKFEPNNIQLLSVYSLSLIENNRPKDAILILNEVIKIDTSDAFAYNNRAIGLLQIGNFEGAKADFDKSAKLDCENPFLHAGYFEYYKLIGDKVNACESLERALKKNMADYGYSKDTKKLTTIWSEYCKF